VLLRAPTRLDRSARNMIRYTICEILLLGNELSIRNVAFTVLPDSAILFATLHPEHQGALGVPVLLALQRVSWDRDGNFRIGQADLLKVHYDTSHSLKIAPDSPLTSAAYGNRKRFAGSQQ
jgi:hypothetical protein